MVIVTIKYKHKAHRTESTEQFVLSSPVDVITEIKNTFDLSGIDIISYTVDHTREPILLNVGQFKVLKK